LRYHIQNSPNKAPDFSGAFYFSLKKKVEV